MVQIGSLGSHLASPFTSFVTFDEILLFLPVSSSGEDEFNEDIKLPTSQSCSEEYEFFVCKLFRKKSLVYSKYSITDSLSFTKSSLYISHKVSAAL